MTNFINKIRQFMIGRYGVDELNRFLMYVVLVLSIISIVVPGIAGLILWLITLALCGYSIFRMLSKNRVRRNLERVSYLKIRTKVVNWWANVKTRYNQRKTHRFFKCPKCHTTVRVPKGRGNIKINCPKCKNSFVRKS